MRFSPARTPPAITASGKLVEGTWRFAGISGTIEFKGRGINVAADGVPGDLFAAGRATHASSKWLQVVVATPACVARWADASSLRSK